jgi:hypothetical protein
LSTQAASSRTLHYDRSLPDALSAQPGGGVRSHALSGAAEKALDTLIAGFATADHLRALAGIGARPEGVTPELVMQRLPFGEEASAELRRLAEQLLRHALGDARAPSEEELERQSTALSEALERAASAEGRPAERISAPRAERGRLTSDVGELLREVGLELLDVSVSLTARQGAAPPVLAARAVKPTTAHVLLLDRLLGRLEASIVGHELLQLEREASRWWFQRWSAEPGREGQRARAIREREWSLAERGTLYMGPVLDNFVGRGLARSIPSRQQRLAQALQASFAGVFVVTARRDDVTVMKDVESGRRVEVLEHDTGIDYDEGWIGLGRLLAFDGAYHVRSTGMAWLGSRSEMVAAQMADSLRHSRSQLAPALAVETLLSAVAGETTLPRPVPAARSYTEARSLVERATRALAEAGLVEDGFEESPEALAAAGAAEGAQVPVRRYKVDSTVGQWLNALFDQTRELRRPGPGRAKAGTRVKGKRGGKNR